VGGGGERKLREGRCQRKVSRKRENGRTLDLLRRETRKGWPRLMLDKKITYYISQRTTEKIWKGGEEKKEPKFTGGKKSCKSIT